MDHIVHLVTECRCAAAGYGTSTATARFTANDEAACTTSFGTLWHGSTARTGTLSTTSCTSDARTPSSATFYAHRYTFTMATAGWVTIDVEGTGSGAAKLDAYAVLLYGHGSGGIVRASDDDSGNGSDARLADLLLAPGRYTVEATTATNEATGGYRVRVQGDFAARAPDQAELIDAKVGQQFTRTWAHLPATASVSVQSVTPAGLDVSIVTDDGSATLTATATHADDYTITVAYTASGHTSTITTTVDANCPPRHLKTETRTCTPLNTYLPEDCLPTLLHDARPWGRLEHAGHCRDYAAVSTNNCASLTHAGRAKFYRFFLRHDLPVLLRLSDERTTLSGLTAGGSPSLSLWRYKTPTSTTGDEYRALRLIASVGTGSGAFLEIEQTLNVGTYLIEIAPSQTVTERTRGFELMTELPTAPKVHTDVRDLGNTGLNGAGMTLGSFLDARGSLIYGAHPDADTTRTEDPFYPESPNYPWLPFTTDRCSVPPAWILHLAEDGADRVAIRAGPIGWLVSRYFLAEADEIQDSPEFGGETVQFVYGCMRHDFNWRNLDRVQSHYVHYTPRGVWTDAVRKDADARLGADLHALCDANQDDAPEISVHFTWELPNREAIRKCKRAATAIASAVKLVPFAAIGYDHG